MELINYSYFLNILLFVLIIIKTIDFYFKKNHNWKTTYWFYFNYNKILLSSNDKRKRIKKIQNSLSLIILAVLLMNISFLIYLKHVGYFLQ